MHFTSLCQFINMFVSISPKMDMNRLIKKHYTSTKAVKLFEDDDNEVFKLLEDGYSSSEASSSESEGISDNDSNELFSSNEISLTCVPDTPQKVTKTSPLITRQQKSAKSEKSRKENSVRRKINTINKSKSTSNTCGRSSCSNILSCSTNAEMQNPNAKIAAGHQWNQLLVQGSAGTNSPFLHEHDKIHVPVNENQTEASVKSVIELLLDKENGEQNDNLLLSCSNVPYDICDAAQVWGGPRATEHTKNASYRGGRAAN